METMETWQIILLILGITVLVAVHLGYPLFLIICGAYIAIRDERRKRAARKEQIKTNRVETTHPRRAVVKGN